MYIYEDISMLNREYAFFWAHIKNLQKYPTYKTTEKVTLKLIIW